jgi:hypothetical protein
MQGFRTAGLALVIGLGSGAWGQQDAAAARERQRVVLVELFTSEGCSSCPPADALLRRLVDRHRADGALIVGLGEHVTYWNSLGWRDRFSSEAFTARQQAYADRFRLDSVFTPQVVVSGQAQVVGSDERGILREIAAAKASAVTLQIRGARVVAGRLAVTYVLSGPVPPAAEVWAALTDDHAVTDVTRGENGGRQLEHVAVARSLTRVGAAADGERTVSLTIPEVLAGQEKSGRHVVVFVQEAGSGPVLAVESQVL